MIKLKVYTKTAADMLRLYSRITQTAIVIESGLSIGEFMGITHFFDVESGGIIIWLLIKSVIVVSITMGIARHVLLQAYNQAMEIESTSFARALYGHVAEEDLEMLRNRLNEAYDMIHKSKEDK